MKIKVRDIKVGDTVAIFGETSIIDGIRPHGDRFAISADTLAAVGEHMFNGDSELELID